MQPRCREGDEQRNRFLELLAAAEARSQEIVFWWRDDDAEMVTPQLDALLALCRRHALPLGLAIIPKGTDEALAARLAEEPRVAVLQHGWRHANHSPPGQKKMELGDDRPIPDILAELQAGFDKLAALFPKNFLPVLVPPWNRIGAAVDAGRRDVGLTGVSMFGPAGSSDPHRVNTHLDIFDWRGTRGPASRAQAYGLLCKEVARRLDGDPEPLGILTHHLIHQGESWDLLDELFGLIAKHPAVSWPEVAELFGLTAPTWSPVRAPFSGDLV